MNWPAPFNALQLSFGDWPLALDDKLEVPRLEVPLAWLLLLLFRQKLPPAELTWKAVLRLRLRDDGNVLPDPLRPCLDVHPLAIGVVGKRPQAMRLCAVLLGPDGKTPSHAGAVLTVHPEDTIADGLLALDQQVKPFSAPKEWCVLRVQRTRQLFFSLGRAARGGVKVKAPIHAWARISSLAIARLKCPLQLPIDSSAMECHLIF
mmetsp:Transcript_29837/g.69369  ORF Transcript_29837/g.69369 Transcript_29837/m.69369 type:complete len:205 (-) Transcript_29837:192-806(-)